MGDYQIIIPDNSSKTLKKTLVKFDEGINLDNLVREVNRMIKDNDPMIVNQTFDDILTNKLKERRDKLIKRKESSLYALFLRMTKKHDIYHYIMTTLPIVVPGLSNSSKKIQNENIKIFVIERMNVHKHKVSDAYKVFEVLMFIQDKIKYQQMIMVQELKDANYRIYKELK